MRTLGFNRYALSVSVAAIMFAGCGGATQFPNPVAQKSLGGAGTRFRNTSPSFATPQRVGPDSSSTEVLAGKAKLIKPCHRAKRGWSTSFSAHGNATGTYPGTFTAIGYWAAYDGRTGTGEWILNETFYITSGSSKINGTVLAPGLYGPPFSCKVVKNLTVPYTSGSLSGNALINIIQKRDFSETFDGM
jgi:hypothetical protein